MKNYSDITESLDITTKQYVDSGLTSKANLSGGNTFSDLQTINAPTNVSGSEQTTMKVKTSNGGAIIFGKEGPNSGSMIRLDQTDGTCRLRFRSSVTAGAMFWEQPESGAQLYVDLGARGGDYHRVQFPSNAGTLALTSQIPTSSTVSNWGFTKNTGTVTSVAVKMNGAEKGKVTSSGTIDLGTVLTDASKFATAAQGTKADNAMPKKGGTFTGEVKFGSTENFQDNYIKRMIGSLGAGTSYANLSSSYKDGTWHRMWRLRFPSGSSFWGKIKVTLYGGYMSFNASGVMSKSITCNFNTSIIYNNVGCYDGLGVNVEQDFRISEAIWNTTASAWEVLIWQKNLNGNNSPVIMLECWTANNTNYINAFNGIAAQTVELTQSTSYSAQKASSTGGTKTVMWEALPVYENPLGEEIATVAMLEDKQDKITSSNKLSASLVSGLATVATSGSYNDLSNKPTIPTVNNGILTIQKNGTTVQTFSANQSSSVTANITVPTKASDVNALSLDGGTINKSKTVKMDASANSDGANLKWGTVNSKNPYIGYASDQVDGTFVVGSLLGTNYASGLAIGGGSGNLLWKGERVATTSDIPNISGKLDKSAFYLSGTTLTITV